MTTASDGKACAIATALFADESPVNSGETPRTTRVLRTNPDGSQPVFHSHVWRWELRTCGYEHPINIGDSGRPVEPAGSP